jgi:hypothetical protein
VILKFEEYDLIELIKRQLLTGQLRKNREVQAQGAENSAE